MPRCLGAFRYPPVHSLVSRILFYQLCFYCRPLICQARYLHSVPCAALWLDLPGILHDPSDDLVEPRKLSLTVSFPQRPRHCTAAAVRHFSAVLPIRRSFDARAPWQLAGTCPMQGVLSALMSDATRIHETKLIINPTGARMRDDMHTRRSEPMRETGCYLSTLQSTVY